LFQGAPFRFGDRDAASRFVSGIRRGVRTANPGRRRDADNPAKDYPP
jgi:hypothetical protein